MQWRHYEQQISAMSIHDVHHNDHWHIYALKRGIGRIKIKFKILKFACVPRLSGKTPWKNIAFFHWLFYTSIYTSDVIQKFSLCEAKNLVEKVQCTILIGNVALATITLATQPIHLVDYLIQRSGIVVRWCPMFKWVAATWKWREGHNDSHQGICPTKSENLPRMAARANWIHRRCPILLQKPALNSTWPQMPAHSDRGHC